jgi:hypothetical protein
LSYENTQQVAPISAPIFVMVAFPVQLTVLAPGSKIFYIGWFPEILETNAQGNMFSSSGVNMAKGNMTAADAAKNMTSNMSSTVKAMNETIEIRDPYSSVFLLTTAA